MIDIPIPVRVEEVVRRVRNFSIGHAVTLRIDESASTATVRVSAEDARLLEDAVSRGQRFTLSLRVAPVSLAAVAFGDVAEGAPT